MNTDQTTNGDDGDGPNPPPEDEKPQIMEPDECVDIEEKIMHYIFTT